MKVPDGNIKLWTDSTVALGWMDKTFVANRITEVQARTQKTQWYHVKGTENPADLASRGVHPTALIDNELWWNGPKWLNDGIIKYKTLNNLNTDLEMKTVKTVNMITINDNEIFERFSKYKKLLKVMAICYRFINKCRKTSKPSGVITMKEIQSTENRIMQLIQHGEFNDDVKKLKEKAPLHKKSIILGFNPFMDNEGVIRIGGRIQNSDLQFDQKHPIILPYKHHVTKLIVEDCHERTLHGNTKLVMALVRQKFWILKCKRLVKTITNNCVGCKKVKGETGEQIMGNLPAVRITPARAFSNTGVDYAGPFEMKCSKLRRPRTYFAGCIFTMSYKYAAIRQQ